MSKERSYLDDLPGVSGYAFGKFHLDDLDFADDPLKRKIDFIDDALLAPPKPGADITSGLKTTREVMGERKAQPTDKVGMRPEDYIRRKPEHVHEERREDNTSSGYQYEEVRPKPAPHPAMPVSGAPVRTAAQNRTRPSGGDLEEAYARYKAGKEAGTAASIRTALPNLPNVRAAVSDLGTVREAVQSRVNAARRMPQTNVKKKKSGLIIGLVFLAIIISQMFTILSETFRGTDVTHEPSGFTGQTGGTIIIGTPDDAEDQWQVMQKLFEKICENPDRAEDYVGMSLEDIGITNEMIEYLVDNAYGITEESDCTIFETEIGEYDIDYYEYEEYAWLRFWSDNNQNVADIAFYYDDQIIQVIDVNGERAAELS